MSPGRRGGGLVAVLAALALSACTNDGPKPTAAKSSSTSSSSGTAGSGAARDREAVRLPARPRRLNPDPPAADQAGATADDAPRRGRWRRADGDDAGPRGDRPSRAEMREMYDTDHDGQLSDEERQIMRESRVSGMVERLDTDHDGRLDRAELEAAATRRRRPPLDFATVDADHDGFVTVEELAAAMPTRGPGGRGWRRDRSREVNSATGPTTGQPPDAP